MVGAEPTMPTDACLEQDCNRNLAVLRAKAGLLCGKCRAAKELRECLRLTS